MNKNKLKNAFLFALFLVNILLLTFFASKTGIKSYIIISSVVTFGWLCFILVVFQRGWMIGRGVFIVRDQNPKEFYINVALLLLGYLMMVFFSTCLYLQEIGYLARN